MHILQASAHKILKLFLFLSKTVNKGQFIQYTLIYQYVKLFNVFGFYFRIV